MRMQSRRNLSLDERVSQRGAPKAATRTTVVEAKGKASTLVRPKRGLVQRPKVDDGPAIQKFLSLYEDRDKEKSKTETKTKTSGSSVVRAADSHVTQKTSPTGVKPRMKVGEVKVPTPRPTKLPQKKFVPESSSTAITEKNITQDNDGERLIPIVMPERNVSTTVINTFITDCIGDDAGTCSTKPNFLLASYEENDLPVFSKRATNTNNIPPSEIIPEGSPMNNSELIIMLRRRNSEPHATSLLQEAPTWNLGCENYYFWSPGIINRNRPFWEVSLFKAATKAASGMLSMSTPTDNCDILTNGFFGTGPMKQVKQATKLSDLSYNKVEQDLASDTPFVTLMEGGRVLSQEAGEVAEELPPKPCDIDLTNDSSKPLQKEVTPRNGQLNRKVHKKTEIRRNVTEHRPAARHRPIIFAIASVVVLLTGAFIFFCSFLCKSHIIFNIVSPIPTPIQGP